MSYRQFVLYNIVGGIGWVTSMLLCGYWLGQIDWISENFELVVIAIALVSVMPIGIGMLKHWLQARKSARREAVAVGAGSGESRHDT
jgi:membrane-associated protein